MKNKKNFDEWLTEYKTTEKFKKDGRGYAYPIVKDAFIAGKNSNQIEPPVGDESLRFRI